MTRTVPVGRTTLPHKEWNHNFYLHCLETNKTTDHALMCKEPSAREGRKKTLASLEAALEVVDTDSQTVQAATLKLNAWALGEEKEVHSFFVLDTLTI